MRKKYYAVATGRKPGIYNSWEECENQVDGFSNARFKSFKTIDEAKRYLSDNTSSVSNYRKVCLLCAKPMNTSPELCAACRRKKGALESRLFDYSHGKIEKVSNRNLLYLKERHKEGDIFDYLMKSPQSYWEVFGASLEHRKENKKKYKSHLAEDKTYRNDEKVPDFAKSLLGPTNEILKVQGNRTDPQIIYRCKRCNEMLYARYSEYKASSGHDCEGIKSSGEIIVEEYLKNEGIAYKTQRNTLQCENPDTGYVMPYDFELSEKRVLIEVQGEQHRSFIPRFHVTEDGFEYQKKKDIYKRQYAEQKGYRLIEIWYDEIEKGYFKQKIREACTNIQGL